MAGAGVSGDWFSVRFATPQSAAGNAGGNAWKLQRNAVGLCRSQRTAQTPWPLNPPALTRSRLASSSLRTALATYAFTPRAREAEVMVIAYNGVRLITISASDILGGRNASWRLCWGAAF